MVTLPMREFLSIKGTDISHGENKKKQDYTTKNPPTIARISRTLWV